MASAAERLMNLGVLPLDPTVEEVRARREELDAITKQWTRTKSRIDAEYKYLRQACDHRNKIEGGALHESWMNCVDCGKHDV